MSDGHRKISVGVVGRYPIAIPIGIELLKISKEEKPVRKHLKNKEHFIISSHKPELSIFVCFDTLNSQQAQFNIKY